MIEIPNNIKKDFARIELVDLSIVYAKIINLDSTQIEIIDLSEFDENRKIISAKEIQEIENCEKEEIPIYE